MAGDDELDIYAQPLSSDEENVEDDQTTNHSSRETSHGAQLTKTNPSPKRVAPTAATSRSKRRKLIQDEPESVVTVTAVQDTDDSFWALSASQKRRLNKGYANRKTTFHVPEPAPERKDVATKKSGFVTYEHMEKKGFSPRTKKGFVNFEPLPGSTPATNVAALKSEINIPISPQRESKSTHSGFRLPDLPDFVSSSTTMDTEVPSIFDASHTPGKGIHSRSTSASSLSSAKSVSSVELDIDLPPLSHRCPVCRKYVNESTRLSVPENLRRLPLQKQRNFCTQHQICDAEDFWEAQKYPTINWKDLEETRIPKKLPFLKRIIARRIASYYLDELDRQLKVANGNRKKIRAYLNEGIVDFAKPGYYGSKGSRIIVKAITEALTDSLKTALQTDKTIREAGVGAFVNAVLVPELTLSFVMEDMKLKSQASGRKVLDESTHVGILLNPDDDHIERNEDDE